MVLKGSGGLESEGLIESGVKSIEPVWDLVAGNIVMLGKVFVERGQHFFA